MARKKTVSSSPIVQYKCTNCGTFSPHENPCFHCGCTQKSKVTGLPIAQKRVKNKKGFGFNVNVR